MEGEAELNREELFLKRLREIKHSYLLWNKETLLLYSQHYPISPDYFNDELRKNYKALEGIDLGVDETSDFDWKCRVMAAIGIGRAIESFHEDGIVVGCLDAEWMLLDQEFNVYVCDFNLQPHLKAMFPQDRMSLLPFPYEGYGRNAPERGHYHIKANWKDYVTMERDIYSYGTLLLMLISKQRFHEIYFHEWIKDVSQEELSNLVHESFLEVEEDEAKKITSLAVSCLSEDPLKRPKIKDVVMCFESLTRDHLGHRDKIRKI